MFLFGAPLKAVRAGCEAAALSGCVPLPNRCLAAHFARAAAGHAFEVKLRRFSADC
jgi:hypothetical protein